MLALRGVATSIPLFIASEMSFINPLRFHRLLATVWHCAVVAVFWMVSVIHIAAKVAGTVKPRAGANENIATKPLRAVVTRRSAAIRGSVVVTVGTFRS